MMPKPLQHFIKSFKVSPAYWYTLLADTITIALLLALWTSFSSYIQNKTIQIGQGRTAEQIQQYLLTLPPEQVQAHMSQLQSFLFIFLGGSIILITATVLIYSASRAFVWNTLNSKKLTSKNFWRWNLLTVTIFVFGLLYALVALLIRLLLVVGIGSFISNKETVSLIGQGIAVLFIVAGILLLFMIKYSFVKHYRIFHSFSHLFHLLGTHLSALRWAYLFGVITFILIGIILTLLQPFLFTKPGYIAFIVNTLLFLLYFSWLRLYLASHFHD